jgi:ketosteroid isomerase-like protein
MSQENVKLVYRGYDSLNQRDPDAVLALMDDDVEIVPRTAAIEGSLHGHEGVRQWWKNMLDVWPDLTVEVVEVRDLGDLTLAAVHLRGHGAGSDLPSEATVWQVSRWREGKCVCLANFDTPGEALKAAGLSE